MNPDHVFSAAFQEINHEVLFVFFMQGLESGLAKLEAAFNEGRVEMLAPVERDHLEGTRHVWRQAVDTNYTPPEHISSGDIYPLSLKSGMYFKKRQYLPGLFFGWQHLTYMPAGTSDFADSLTNVMHVALQIGEVKMARCAAELFLSHYDLSNMVSATLERFRDNIEQTILQPLPEAPGQNWDMPWVEALKGIEEDPSDCWVRILRITIEQTPEEDRSQKFHGQVFAALQTFYEDTGNLSELEFLQAYR